MTIYSYIMGAVVLNIGEETYRIDGPDKVEIKLPAGDHPFTAYIAYSDDGTPVIKQSFQKRYEGGQVTYVYLATTGTLAVSGNAELNIRTTDAAFRGVKGYAQTLLEFETQNCELLDRRDGFLNESFPKKIIRGCKIKTVLMYVLALLIMAMGVTFTVLLSSVIGEAAPLSENEFLDILPMLLSPILAIFVITQVTRDLRFIKISKNISILTEGNHHDDL